MSGTNSYVRADFERDVTKLKKTDRKFLRSLAELVARDFVKKYGERPLSEVEVELADEVEKTTVICLETKL